MTRSFIFIFASLLITAAEVQAQTNPGLPEQIGRSTYDPAALFAPGFYDDLHLATRSPDGAPSSVYWQNRADYTLAVRLDTTTNEMEGSDIIHYTNNSPDSLHSLWLYLEQQTYRTDARSNYYTTGVAGGHTEGDQLESIKIQQNGVTLDASYIITDTR